MRSAILTFFSIIIFTLLVVSGYRQSHKKVKYKKTDLIKLDRELYKTNEQMVVFIDLTEIILAPKDTLSPEQALLLNHYVKMLKQYRNDSLYPNVQETKDLRDSINNVHNTNF